MSAKKYRVVRIIVTKCFINIFIFFSFVLNQAYHINVFYYYTKTILLYNLGYTFQNLYLNKVLIIFLMNMNIFYMFTLFILIKVKFNLLDIFFRINMQIIYRVFMFTLLFVVFIFILFNLLIVDNNSNVVFYSFSGDELNRLRFPFV